MIVDHPVPVDELLRPAMGTFLQTIQDEDLQVRRVAIVTLNSAAHNKPKLVTILQIFKVLIVDFFRIVSIFIFIR